MSSAHYMNTKKCVHAQKSYPSQAFAHESSKVGERDRKDRSQVADGKEGSQTKQKHIWGTKQVLPIGTAMVESLRIHASRPIGFCFGIGIYTIFELIVPLVIFLANLLLSLKSANNFMFRESNADSKAIIWTLI